MVPVQLSGASPLISAFGPDLHSYDVLQSYVVTIKTVPITRALVLGPSCETYTSNEMQRSSLILL